MTNPLANWVDIAATYWKRKLRRENFPFGKDRYGTVLPYPGTCWMSSWMSGTFRTISGTCYCCSPKLSLPPRPLQLPLELSIWRKWTVSELWFAAVGPGAVGVATNCGVYCKWFIINDKACTFSDIFIFITVIHALNFKKSNSFTKLVTKSINSLSHSRPLVATWTLWVGVYLHISTQHASTVISWFLLTFYYRRRRLSSFILPSLNSQYCSHFCQHLLFTLVWLCSIWLHLFLLNF